MKLLQENIGSKLLAISQPSNEFFGYDTKNNGNKEKNKWDNIKLKSFITAKKNIKIKSNQLTPDKMFITKKRKKTKEKEKGNALMRCGEMCTIGGNGS